MTEDQIERAARALCRMRGLDPRELVERVPRWCHAAKEISAALQIQQAIKEACEPEKVHPSFVGEMKAGSELKHAEDLLNEAVAYLCAKGSVSDASFKAGLAHGFLVGQIRRFLDRKGA
jgi:hypothetical protein